MLDVRRIGKKHPANHWKTKNTKMYLISMRTPQKRFHQIRHERFLESTVDPNSPQFHGNHTKKKTESPSEERSLQVSGTARTDGPSIIAGESKQNEVNANKRMVEDKALVGQLDGNLKALALGNRIERTVEDKGLVDEVDGNLKALHL